MPIETWLDYIADAVQNPFQPCRCPFCFKTFHLGQCELLSVKNNPLLGTTTTEVLRPQPQGIQKALGYIWAPPLVGEAYAKARASRRCPHCQEVLPYNLGMMDNFFLAIIGSRYSGKSHYITALINELRTTPYQHRLGFAEFDRLNADVERRYNALYKTLFIERKSLKPTETARTTADKKYKPLVYTMHFTERGDGATPRPINLVFYDIAGEDLHDEDSIEDYAPYILEASAIILLVDPVVSPNLRSKLATAPTLGDTARQAYEVLERVTSIRRRRQWFRSGQGLSVSLAVTLAKSDLLRYFMPQAELKLGPVLEDGVYRDGLSLDDVRRVSDEVEGLLNYVQEPVVQRSLIFPNRQYFAVSATGAPDSNGQYPNEIQPRRCLDPLLWILWKCGLISATETPTTGQIGLLPPPGGDTIGAGYGAKT